MTGMASDDEGGLASLGRTKGKGMTRDDCDD